MSALLRKPSAFENSFAHEQEFKFKAQARRNKLIGLWAAATMGHDNAAAYADEMMVADIVNPDGVFTRLRSDFDAAGVAVLDDEIRTRMVSLLKDAAEDMYIR
jgi:hypothetical protein